MKIDASNRDVYWQGFRDGMKVANNSPFDQTFYYMGYSEKEIANLIDKDQNEKFYAGEQWTDAEATKLKERQMDINREHAVNQNDKYKWAKEDAQSDREFLEWVWQRLHTIYGEHPDCYHMRRLDKIIQETSGKSSVRDTQSALMSIMTEVNIKQGLYAGHISQYGAGCIIDGLKNKGYKIVPIEE